MDKKDGKLIAFIAPSMAAGTPPTMKDVFDNLRNYPILVVMAAGTLLIPQSHTVIATAALVFWTAVLGTLLLLSAYQTAVLAAACFAYFAGAIPLFRSRGGQFLAISIALALFFIAVTGSLEMAVALRSIQGKS
jgi:hypothetical protein